MVGFGVGRYGHGFDWAIPLALLSILPFLIVWTFFWKGLALWHSAQRKEAWWFIALLLINTLGILEIVYLFGFAKLKFNELFTSKNHH